MARALDAAVVGAGPAGLSAAWALARGGARVTLYEARETVGGRLRTEALDGARVDVAVQLLAAYYRETFRLAEETGAAGLLVRSPGRDALWRAGRAHGLVYGSVASMTASRALPAGLKLRLAARYLGFLARHAAELDANEPIRAITMDDESIAEWGARELGRDFVELLAYPLLGAYYGATPEHASAGFYHGLARAGVDVALFAVRGGVAALAAQIASALEASGTRIRYGWTARRIIAGADRVELHGGDAESATHDAAVLALPPAVVTDVAAPGAAAREWLAGVQVAPAASLALLLSEPLAVNYFGLSVPRTETPGRRVVAVCVQRNKVPGLVPEGKGLVVAYPAPEVAGEVAGAAPEQALEMLLPALEQLLPGVRERVERARFSRIPEGGVNFYPGYLKHLARFEASMLPPRLALAGDYLVAPTVEGAVVSGRRAAQRLLSAAAPGGRRGGG